MTPEGRAHRDRLWKWAEELSYRKDEARRALRHIPHFLDCPNDDAIEPDSCHQQLCPRVRQWTRIRFLDRKRAKVLAEMRQTK